LQIIFFAVKTIVQRRRPAAGFWRGTSGETERGILFEKFCKKYIFIYFLNFVELIFLQSKKAGKLSTTGSPTTSSDGDSEDSDAKKFGVTTPFSLARSHEAWKAFKYVFI
jgi:hypothetical protein